MSNRSSILARIKTLADMQTFMEEQHQEMEARRRQPILYERCMCGAVRFVGYGEQHA